MDAMTADHRAVVTLPTDTQILITREFAAPRELVWRAWTEPDLIAQWWHADRGSIVSIEMDLRVGGAWRYVMRATNGFEVAFHGECREVVPFERLVSTEVYEAVPDEPAVNTAVFEDFGAGTRLTLLVEHATQAGRDMHVNSGMEDGLQDALRLLEGLAQRL
jgi:uncharacterized protein YndB with AHSA1/START domain